MTPEFPVDVRVLEGTRRVFITVSARRQNTMLFSRLRRAIEKWVKQLEFDTYLCHCSLYNSHQMAIIDIDCDCPSTVKLAASSLLDSVRHHARQELETSERDFPFSVSPFSCLWLPTDQVQVP